LYAPPLLRACSGFNALNHLCNIVYLPRKAPAPHEQILRRPPPFAHRALLLPAFTSRAAPLLRRGISALLGRWAMTACQNLSILPATCNRKNAASIAA
jgi:hypothetical protein